MPNIVAIVVTYNRKYLLDGCLNALLAQRRGPDRIIIIDNASTDGTEELLRDRGYHTHSMIEYVRLSENLGGAGGFCEGIKRGVEKNFDWIWLLDDDTYPAPSCLERLLQGVHYDRVVGLSPKVLSPTGEELPNWFFFDVDRLVKRFTSSEEIPSPPVIQCATFNGLLICGQAAQTVGLPLKDFFIWHDDIEYCLRLSRIGLLYAVPDSVIVHHAEGTTGRMPIQGYWKAYYGIRNYSFFCTYSRRKPQFLFYYIYRTLRQMSGIFLYDDFKLRRMKILLSGLRDGIVNLFRLSRGSS